MSWDLLLQHSLICIHEDAKNIMIFWSQPCRSPFTLQCEELFPHRIVESESCVRRDYVNNRVSVLLVFLLFKPQGFVQVINSAKLHLLQGISSPLTNTTLYIACSHVVDTTWNVIISQFVVKYSEWAIMVEIYENSPCKKWGSCGCSLRRGGGIHGDCIRWSWSRNGCTNWSDSCGHH